MKLTAPRLLFEKTLNSLFEISVFLECVSVFPRITLSVGEYSSLCLPSSREDDAPNPKHISGLCDAGQLRGGRQTKDMGSDEARVHMCVCVCARVCKEHEGPHLLLSTVGLSLCLKELG